MCEDKLAVELAALIAEFKAFKELMNERHDRYSERDLANKERVAAAFDAAEQALAKTEAALKEYKVGANEWRDTVKDLISRGAGMGQLWGWIAAGVTVILAGIALYVT